MAYEEPKYPVGPKIKQFRNKKGWTINKLANQAGVSQSYLRNVELSNKNCTVEFLHLICNALDITLYEFFDDTKADGTDLLSKCINTLKPEQREKLIAFLESIQ